MIVLAVCTEGENSEPNYIKALMNILWGTTFRGNLAIETVPLGGNHGFKKIFEKAEEEISILCNDDDSILAALGEEDKIEKWMIVDYDKMHKHGISEEWLRGEADKNRYRLIINKPNFEFFVLMHFLPIDEVACVPMKGLKGKINEEINKYNEEKGFNKDGYSALHLPAYAKNDPQSLDLFWRLLDQNSKLLDVFDKKLCYFDENHYTEMWKIIDRMKDIDGVSE